MKHQISQMVKLYILIFSTIILNSCNSKTNNFLHKAQNGIVYFSYNNGTNWINSSNGLPENIRIGLGGIATSNRTIGAATKDNGVYLYNFKNKIWDSIPTGKQIIEGNIGALAIFDSAIFVGTQFKGVFYTTDKGIHWRNINNGLKDLTIRRFCEFEKILYVCTNDGFYSFNKISDSWKLEFGQTSLQTNGATFYKGNFYLATNKGIFSQQTDKSWINSSSQFSLHNISSDKNQLYAMTYNELLLSSTDGKTWQSQQNGLPKKLYTFNVLNHNNFILAGQWDGVYKKTNNETMWKLSSQGLPTKFAVTNLKAYNNILIISTSERKLKEGMTTEK